MVFGWKTSFEKRISAEGLSSWEVFTVAEQACKELEWEYLIVDEHTFTATTPTHWTLSEEIITITVEENEIIFRSQSESLELYEAGRNQRNLEEQLLPAFRKTRWRWKADELAQRAASLKVSALKQIKSGSRVDLDKMTFGVRDHEMTFFLIAVLLLVFGIMSVYGVNYLQPSVETIISWGGNIKYNIVGGEWWRLLTSIFVHIGIIPLLVNLFGLYAIGLGVEPILGKLKFLVAFVATGVIANLASIILTPEGVTAGASGAVFGFYGVLFAFATTNYINKRFPKLWLGCIAAYAVFNIMAGWNGGNDNAGNLGGVAAGVITGYLFYFFHFKKNLARAGGTRISVEILLITGLLIFFYLRKNGRNDALHFEKTVMRLNQIEVKAMAEMQRLQDKSNKEASKFLRDTALPEWRHFQQEIMKTDRYSLDSEFKQKRKLLSQYAHLRVLQTELIYKSISEETDKYNAQIDEVSNKIDEIIDKLGA